MKGHVVGDRLLDYRPRHGDQPGVWVLDNSDGGKEKFFVFSRIKSVRETTVDDLL